VKFISTVERSFSNETEDFIGNLSWMLLGALVVATVVYATRRSFRQKDRKVSSKLELEGAVA